MFNKEKAFIESGERNLKVIFSKIRRRDFSGNSGIAIKNSFFSFSTNLIKKVGSLLFTIIIARMLLPELFGLYSLALYTILLFFALTEIGLGQGLIRFVSKNRALDYEKTSAYYNYFLKIKIILTLVISSLLGISAYFIANFYYNKPIFFALAAGSLYIFVNGFITFYNHVFIAYNRFEKDLIKESIFQISRIILVPLSILIFLDKSEELLIFYIILSLVISSFFSLIYLFVKKPSFSQSQLNKTEKKNLFLFVIPLSATALSGMFLSYIDVIILGAFVQAEFIGYYQAALALLGSVGAFIIFSNSFFPLFSSLKDKPLFSLFKKSIFLTILFSILGIIATILLSNFIINFVYGSEYSPSILILKVLSPMLFLIPLVGLYSSFYISQDKTSFVAKLFIFSTVLNIILNYYLITYLVQHSDYYAVFGAGIATMISHSLHLFILIIKFKPLLKNEK